MWAQFLNITVGLWLMMAPWALDYAGPAATNDRIVGPCAASLAGVAVGRCTRGVRWWLLPFAAWLLIAPVALEFGSGAAVANSLGSGAAIMLFTPVGGRVTDHFGGGWTALFRSNAYDSGSVETM